MIIAMSRFRVSIENWTDAAAFRAHQRPRGRGQGD